VILAEVRTESIKNAFGADISGIAKQVGAIPKVPKCLGGALRPCPSLYLAASGNGPFREQQLEQDRTSQEEYLALLKKHGAPLDEKYLWD
jgi:hypothetical protein